MKVVPCFQIDCEGMVLLFLNSTRLTCPLPWKYHFWLALQRSLHSEAPLESSFASALGALSHTLERWRSISHKNFVFVRDQYSVCEYGLTSLRKCAMAFLFSAPLRVEWGDSEPAAVSTGLQ